MARDPDATHPSEYRAGARFHADGGLAAVSMECVDGATLTQWRLDQAGRVFSRVRLPQLARIGGSQ